ncbi:MAG TPA: hypothetical protein VMW15_10970 [Terracidiphilus sp.]|nr:hypothetical protein [Terracidiphilus sp.]
MARVSLLRHGRVERRPPVDDQNDAPPPHKKSRFRQTYETKSLANPGQNGKNRHSVLQKQSSQEDNQQISINLDAKSALRPHAQFALFFAQKQPKSPLFRPILMPC